MRHWTFIYFALSLATITSLTAQQKFSKDQVLNDLNYLYQSLEETHYNLFAYTPKAEFKANFEHIKKTVDQDSLSLLEASNLMQAVASKANNGHTEVPFPAQAYIHYAQNGGSLFPLELAFEKGKALIRKNFSEQKAIMPGDRILKINGQAIEEVLHKMSPLISAEREYFKLAKMELLSFPRLYWQAFGAQEQFQVELMRETVTKSYTLKAIPLISGYETQRREIYSTKLQLRFYDDIAYLHPGSFGGDLSRYKAQIDSSFALIREKKALILDLRNNLGGDDAFSSYLLSYIADSSFSWCGNFTLKSSDILKESVRAHWDTSSAYAQKILNSPSGSRFQYKFPLIEPQLTERRFKGKVLVLINRQSHSQATVSAALIKDKAWADLMGEETGEYGDKLLASALRFKLPETCIEVQSSKGLIHRYTPSQSLKGVLPDHDVQDHLLDEKDEILAAALKHLQN